jgi:hypothetical protein
MRTELLRFKPALERDPAIDAWMHEHGGEIWEPSRNSIKGFVCATEVFRDPTYDDIGPIDIRSQR